MRTRFLNIDYFTPFSSSSIQSLEPLSFLKLPVPHLAASTLSTSIEDFICFDSVLQAPLEIDPFPIDTALSKFLAEVIPQHIDVQNGSSQISECRSRNALCSGSVELRFSEKEVGILYEEKEEDFQRNSKYKTPETEFPKEDNRISLNAKDKIGFEVVQFETPELDVFLENACFSENEMHILSGLPEIDNKPDMHKPGLIMRNPFEILESVYSVEDITSEYYMEQKAILLEDDGSVQDQFPLLEVDEMSLGTLSSLSKEDELLLLLENIEIPHWLHKDNLIINSKELLGSMEYNISEFPSNHCLSKQCLESELESPGGFSEMDFISLVESSYIQVYSASDQGMSDGDCFLSVSPVKFEEFQILDVNSSQLFEVFLSIETGDEETCDKMLIEDMNFKNFNDLVVSCELTLVDDTFKSLPVPVLSYKEKTRSVYDTAEEILADVKPNPLSASDGIYLDWHLLEEDKCNLKVNESYQNMLEEIDFHSLGFDPNSFDGEKLVVNFIFSDDASNGPNTEEYKETLNMISGGIFMCNGNIEVAPSKLLEDACPKPEDGEELSCTSTEMAPLSFKSRSYCNDLDFFLNPQKATAGENSEATFKVLNTNATIPKVPISDSTAARMSPGVQLQERDIMTYHVKLSDNIVSLIDNFQKRYLAILENETELTKTHYLSVTADRFKLLSLSKQTLLDCIKKASVGRTTSALGGENIMAFVTLCAIKQMAWYMCFYGIHTTRLYVDNLYRNLDCLESRLSFLRSLIEDAYGKSDKEITESHPALAVIRGILLSNSTQSSFKVLIVAEQVFWSTLKRLLNSMGLSFNELHSNQPDLNNSKMDGLLLSDCLLVSQKHVSPFFPFNKFGIVLEYEGSYGSSVISTLSPGLVGLPSLHFLKVELDDSSASKALCQGVDMPQNIETKKDGKPCSIQALDENMNEQKLKELLNFVPVEDKYNVRILEAADSVETCSMPPLVPCVPHAMEQEQIQQGVASFPYTVLIVNTKSFDKEMIVSRRSTYQQILAMEKEGVQVAERDSDLPIDIIVNAAICLVWYDCRNIGKKTTALDEASSSLPLCIENIATNVLTLLSFTFSGCFLVFEGEISFLATVMESSDGLYAAAASLGIDLQLFCSYSSESTDEIILSCIGYATKLTRGLYPKMPESETLAESFLTKFPSINPLTAHAIVSSGGMLIEFLEWSHERRVHAIRKYCVPNESITLFSTLCKYGEREDSKSIMTDCSSSVSSGFDSEKCNYNVDTERKRQKCIVSPKKIDIDMDDLMHFEPRSLFTDGNLDPSSLALNDLFGQKQGLEIAKPPYTQMSKGPQRLYEIKRPRLPLNDKIFGQNQGSDMDVMTNIDWDNINDSENLHGDLIGEVIDLTKSPLFGEDFSSIPNFMKFSPSPSEPEKELDLTRKSKIARRLSFDKGSYRSFPTAAEINSGSDVWNCAKNQGRSLQGGSNGYAGADFNKDKLPLNHRQKLSEEGLIQRSAGSLPGKHFQEKEIPYYSGTPLSNAIRSTHLQQHSPWTIEFLNRIREKSRLRKQSLQSEISSPCFGYSGNISKVTKRRSPSIIDFFKYQGSSSAKKTPGPKRQKQSIQPSSSSKNDNSSTSLLRPWTPIDKRARQTLSFAMNESGGQTKLVWSDGGVHSLNKRFRN